MKYRTSKIVRPAIAIAVAGIPGASFAADRPQPAAAVEGARVVCRKESQVGSMLNRRMICRTSAAWNMDPDDRRRDSDYSNEPPLKLRAPSADQSVAAGSANWANLAVLKTHGRLPYVQLVSQVEALLSKQECKLDGQSAKSFDIDVPFAVMLSPDGRVSRVIVSDTTCVTLNALVGLVVLARSERGDFEFDGAPERRWYASSINFTLQ